MKKILLTLFTITALFINAQNIIYVDKDAIGIYNGDSWANAYANPQDAFDNANANDEIWIAEGSYVRNSTIRTASFFWNVDSLTVLGGFNGTETSASQRNTNIYQTILSGEVNNNADVTDNVYNVLKGPQGSSSNPITFALIDGIIIQDGYADNVGTGDKWGGGFLLQSYVEHIEFNDCIFRNNYAQGGAALFLKGSGTTNKIIINNCIIEENTGDYASAIVTLAPSYLNLEVNNSLIVNNLTKSFTGTTTLGSCFYLNSAGDSDINFYNTTISNNIDSTNGNGGTKNLFFYYVEVNPGINNLNIQNCIMYNNVNTTKTISEFTASHNPLSSINISSSISEIANSDVVTIQTDVITSDPLFVNSQNNFLLGTGSPAINTGSQTGITVLAEDLNGDARIVGPEIDMGCYEKQSIAPVLVSSITVQGQGGVSTITTNGGTLQMEADVLPMNADDATYTWSVTNGTGSATIDANGLLIASADGTVDVEATANDASGVTGSKTITISNQSVGINDIAFENVSVYPNPTSGILNLDIQEELSSIKIMDISGRTIQVFNPENTQVDISSFTTGIYFLEIANAEKKSVVKIIKR